MNHYNNYGIFRWNECNKLFTNENNIYNNVYLHTGSIIKNEFHNSICVVKENDVCKVISNSNNYLHGYQWNDEYNVQYKIYDNLVKNYVSIQSSNDYSINLDFFDDNTYFYMIDAFSFSNSGHNLSIILDMLKYILDNNIKNILIYKNYRTTHNFKLINLLLPTDINIIELDINTIYNIKNIIIIYPEIYNILKHKNLIQDLKNKIIDKYSNIYSDYKCKNLILMKTNRNKNVMLEYTCINCEKLLVMLENDGYINLIPEEEDIFKLCLYLIYANKIIFSTGSVVYTNKIFFNENAKLFGIDYYLNTPTRNDFNGLLNINYLFYNKTLLSDEDTENFYKNICKL